jgi:zinc/manganese transport system ATP-binding protein
MSAALQFRNLTLGYDRHPAVHHLDGAVETGALVAVVGPNGAGKSTLFKGIVGAIKPSPAASSAEAQARDITTCRSGQNRPLVPHQRHDMVAMGLWRRTGLFGGVGAGGHRSRGAAVV